MSPTFDLDLQKAVNIDINNVSSGGSFKGSDASFLPTDEYGNIMTVAPEEIKVSPTDELGREILPIVYFNNTPLTTDDYQNTYNVLGQKIDRDDENRAIGPDNRPLRLNNKGSYVYPPIDKYGQPIPTDPTNLKPIYTVANSDGIEHKKDSDGRSLNLNGNPVPTDLMGQPVGVDASPLPTDFYGRYIADEGGESTTGGVLPTDQMGFEIHSIVDANNQLLSTAASGIYLNAQGEEVSYFLIKYFSLLRVQIFDKF